jgi:hypothetical protein
LRLPLLVPASHIYGRSWIPFLTGIDLLALRGTPVIIMGAPGSRALGCRQSHCAKLDFGWATPMATGNYFQSRRSMGVYARNHCSKGLAVPRRA